jgi:hypothetical protein
MKKLILPFVLSVLVLSILPNTSRACDKIIKNAKSSKNAKHPVAKHPVKK